MNAPKNGSKIWLSVIGLVIVLVGTACGGVAWSFNTFAAKEEVAKIEGQVSEVRDNLMIYLSKQGHDWKYSR